MLGEERAGEEVARLAAGVAGGAEVEPVGVAVEAGGEEGGAHGCRGGWEGGVPG